MKRLDEAKDRLNRWERSRLGHGVAAEVCRVDLPFLIRRVETLQFAIEHMMAMAGNPSASEGCRLIIKRGREALVEE